MIGFESHSGQSSFMYLGVDNQWEHYTDTLQLRDRGDVVDEHVIDGIDTAHGRIGKATRISSKLLT